MIKLFTYGTLMTGQNHHYMVERSDFISNCWTFGKLLIDEDYVVLKTGKDLVRGELYEVNDNTLKEIFDYEGESYQLEEIDAYLPPHMNIIKCHAFVGRTK